jgi:hypothetical protein
MTLFRNSEVTSVAADAVATHGSYRYGHGEVQLTVKWVGKSMTSALVTTTGNMHFYLGSPFKALHYIYIGNVVFVLNS